MKFRKFRKTYYLSTGQEYEYTDWVIFYWGNIFNISFESCGYFDNRPRINLSLIFFSLTIVLPFRNKWTDECVPPKWGIAIHNKIIWIYRGGKGNMSGGNKWWTFHLPFITKEWVRTSILLKDGTWEHETNGNRKHFYKEGWEQKQMKWEYDYTDSFDGEIIPTTIYVKEVEWNRKWLQWTTLFAENEKSIDVHFSKQCGREKGSWKGGTLQCGYILLPHETPLDCLKRMEVERKF